MSLFARLLAVLHRHHPAPQDDAFGDRLSRLVTGQHPRRQAMRARRWPSPFRSPA
ncbi:hypothetical protein [Frigidibacter sp. MR17.24]|uniref:hypothetical protein n=1 Tax=Frigidibacter sp. MR17.24 TaxID=3127345 RepID=UPI003012D2F7